MDVRVLSNAHAVEVSQFRGEDTLMRMTPVR